MFRIVVCTFRIEERIFSSGECMFHIAEHCNLVIYQKGYYANIYTFFRDSHMISWNFINFAPNFILIR